MGHNTRYGTALCALSASPLPVYGTNIHSGWLNYFGVLSSLIHARVFPLRSYRCTYRFVPNRVRENTNNEAIEATSSLGCSCFPYSPLLYFYFFFFAYKCSPYIVTQWGFYIRHNEHVPGRRSCWPAWNEGTRLQTKPWRKIGVRRFSWRRCNPRGGLHDSASEGWIIRAITLWVHAIIRLVHIFNIQWDISGRRVQEEAKGQLSRATCHVPIKMCKHTHACCQWADFSAACVCVFIHSQRHSPVLTGL